MNATLDDHEEADALLFQYLGGLTNEQLGELLSSCGLAKSGTKDDLVSRLEKSYEDGIVSKTDLVSFLNQADRWGKQHVYLYKGPGKTLQSQWGSASIEQTLAGIPEVQKCLNKELPLVVPEEPKLCSVMVSRNEISISLVGRRDHWVRVSDQDEEYEDNGKKIIKKAFVHTLHRNLTVFTWDLLQNHATLQISQLPSGNKYEDSRDAMLDTIRPWFPVDSFDPLDLRPAVKELHQLEMKKTALTRAQAISIVDGDGYTAEAKGPTADHSLDSNSDVAGAMNNLVPGSLGKDGNFYWLPKTTASGNGVLNPLEKEIRTHIVAHKGRVNFTTSNGGEAVIYVLNQIRAVC